MIFPQERKISLHNCFVFYLIDVLVIGEKAAGDTKNTSRKEILEIKRHFRPFTFWNSSQKGKYLVELGFPGDYDVGDMIEIK
jgi:hypothetical protein